MSDLRDFLQLLDRNITSVADELAERDRASEAVARTKPSVFRAMLWPALAVLGGAALVWATLL